ncbi:hypothetical protein CR513_25087, partial [Mucuna pruriens]
MGEANVQTQHETIIANSPTTTPQKHIPNSPPSPMCDHQNLENREDHAPLVEPTDLFSMMHLTNGYCHRHPPYSAANNPMKRRSPPSSSSSGEPSAKKLFCDQEDLTLHGFSAIPIPLSLVNRRPSVPVLRRCVSDPYHPPTPPRPSGLPPLPPSSPRRSPPELTPSPDKALSRLGSEETAALDSVRLRRIKDRFKEMRQWWDQVIKDDEDESALAQHDKLLPNNDLGGEDCEEAVSVEWAEKCLSLVFRCPCGKGYEVLLSENNCYYKLFGKFFCYSRVAFSCNGNYNRWLQRLQITTSEAIRKATIQEGPLESHEIGLPPRKMMYTNVDCKKIKAQAIQCVNDKINISK